MTSWSRPPPPSTSLAWTTGLGATKGDLAEVIVRQPSYFTTLSQALEDVPLDDWLAWLYWQVVHSSAPYLTLVIVAESFHSTNDSGRHRGPTGPLEARRGPWCRERSVRRSVSSTSQRHFPPRRSSRWTSLVANLVEAYRRNIDALEWMAPRPGEGSREAGRLPAEDRLSTNGGGTTRRVEIARDDLLGNVRRSAAFETERQLGKLGGSGGP